MIFTVKTNYPNIKCFILVLDSETTKVISSVIKIVELMEEGVTTLEKLELKRKRFPNVHAIYFISGSKKCVHNLMKDFADISKPQYAAAHIFFSNQLSQDLFKDIGECGPLISRTLTFMEFNLDFMCTESSIFHCNLP